jgi:hypothetical protein
VSLVQSCFSLAVLRPGGPHRAVRRWQGLGDLRALEPTLRSLGRRHREYGVTPEHVRLVSQVGRGRRGWRRDRAVIRQPRLKSGLLVGCFARSRAAACGGVQRTRAAFWSSGVG